MLIQIDDKHRISSDRYQWVLQEFRPYQSKGETVENWNAVGYYSRLDHLVTALFDLKLRLSDAEGIAEATLEAEKVAKLLQTALSNQKQAA